MYSFFIFRKLLMLNVILSQMKKIRVIVMEFLIEKDWNRNRGAIMPNTIP
jgi:hypothetical protein